MQREGVALGINVLNGQIGSLGDAAFLAAATECQNIALLVVAGVGELGASQVTPHEDGVVATPILDVSLFDQQFANFLVQRLAFVIAGAYDERLLSGLMSSRQSSAIRWYRAEVSRISVRRRCSASRPSAAPGLPRAASSTARFNSGSRWRRITFSSATAMLSASNCRTGAPASIGWCCRWSPTKRIRSTPCCRAAFRIRFVGRVASKLDSSTIPSSGPVRGGNGFWSRLAIVRALTPASRSALTLPLVIPNPRTL